MDPKHVIVDLDGTLFDDRHRQHFIVGVLKPDWEAYHGGIPDDKVNGDVEEVVNLLSADGYVIHALTGRPVKYKGMTHAKLQKHGVPVDMVTMRADNDWSPNGEMKLRALEQFFGNKDLVLLNVHIVLENDPKTTELMRNYGLTVWQVRAQ